MVKGGWIQLNSPRQPPSIVLLTLQTVDRMSAYYIGGGTGDAWNALVPMVGSTPPAEVRMFFVLSQQTRLLVAMSGSYVCICLGFCQAPHRPLHRVC